MKRLKLGGIKLANGLRVKTYPIEVYDGDLYEMPQINRIHFDLQMQASGFVPTNQTTLDALNVRMYDAFVNNKEEMLNITSNMLSGISQRMENFTCKDHAFYCLIKGVTDFSEENAKRKMKILYSHGLNEFMTNDICEDVKKKYIPNYKEASEAYSRMELLIKNC